MLDRPSAAPPQSAKKTSSPHCSVRLGPLSATVGPMVSVAFERVEALELLAMTLAHLNDAESRGEVSLESRC